MFVIMLMQLSSFFINLNWISFVDNRAYRVGESSFISLQHSISLEVSFIGSSLAERYKVGQNQHNNIKQQRKINEIATESWLRVYNCVKWKILIIHIVNKMREKLSTVMEIDVGISLWSFVRELFYDSDTETEVLRSSALLPFLSHFLRSVSNHQRSSKVATSYRCRVSFKDLNFEK